MFSNVYLASGDIDGIRVMKVGKTNDVKMRQRQLSIRIEYHCPVSDVGMALKIEDEFRVKVLQNGGVQYNSTTDWFLFDQRIYEMIKEDIVRMSTLESSDFIAGYKKGLDRFIEYLTGELERQKSALRLEQSDGRYIDNLMREFRENRCSETSGRLDQALALIRAGWHAPYTE